MSSRDPHRQPTFVWQAALIVLPVIVLAAVGLVSLRQDRLLAKKDAEEKAQTIASELVAKAWQNLTASNHEDHAFRADKQGNLIFPPRIAELPSPRPFRLTDLTPEQLRLWNSLRNPPIRGSEETADIQTYQAFLNSDPPNNFKSVAEYGLGLVLAARGRSREAAEAFENIVERNPTAVGDSGLPLQPLAQLKILEVTSFGFGYYELTNHPRGVRFGGRPLNSVSPRVLDAIPHTNSTIDSEPPISLESFCSNVVYYPSPLSPFFLDTISDRLDNLNPGKGAFVGTRAFVGTLHPTIRVWQALWREHEASRELFQAAGRYLSNAPPVFWFRADGDDWLATGFQENTAAQWYVCRSRPDLASQLDSLVAQRTLPNYLGIGFEVAGKSLTPPGSDLRTWKEVNYGGKGGGVTKHFLSDFPVPTLASNTPTALLATATHSEAGADLLKVNVYLTSPDQLFKRQTARSFWFGSLIAVSAAAALIGLWTAWSAFHSQQRLSEMKSNFVSSVSHELRAPIASVRLLADSLEKGKIQQPDKQVEYFRFIGQECRRLSGLIQNVLDFSRIEQGRKQYDFEPTDVMALVKETVGLMQTYAIEKDVNLKLDGGAGNVDKEKLELTLDSRAIQQALINLIDNAIKHSPKGREVIVGIMEAPPTQGEDEYDGTCSIWVEDKGPGIPLKEHEKIFERFYRVGSELRRETQGVGIGLSIVKHVVEAHGGRVRVRSVPGEGSRFTIELPLSQGTS